MSDKFASPEETYFEAIRLFSEPVLASMSRQTRVNILLLISEVIPIQKETYNLRQSLNMGLLSDAMWPDSLDPSEIEIRKFIASQKLSPELTIRNKLWELIEDEKKNLIRMAIKSMEVKNLI